MANYEMQESNLPNEEGRKVLFPRMVIRHQVGLDAIARTVSYASTFTPGDIKGLVIALADEMARLMGEGNSVKIDGIGTFTPSLGLRRRRGARKRRRGRLPAQCRVYLRGQYPLPGRKGFRRQNGDELRPPAFEGEIPPLLAALLAPRAVAAGVGLLGYPSVSDGGGLLQTDRLVARHSRPRTEAVARGPGDRHTQRRAGVAQGVCETGWKMII